ncbi:MAG: glycosyltransferase family 87 protein [Prevotellaceae bacterium]|nr:glycosyltransferase family 87 protein [Prevotellaceae bacterium]
MSREKIVNFLTCKYTIFAVWMVFTIFSIINNQENNYKIFHNVFWHVWDGKPLYIPYPEEYVDVNLYGPFFSVLIAPFALLPWQIGLIFWNVGLTLLMYLTIRKSTFSWNQQLLLLWFSVNEFYTAVGSAQFNIAIAALIFLTCYAIEKEKDVWAALCIVIGTFVKLYGIVGLAFFFFSKHKWKFLLYLLMWSAIAFVLPMVLNSPEYIIGQYGDWYDALVAKNELNLDVSGQNISVLGMIRVLSGFATYSDLWIIIPGLILLALPYLRISQYKYLHFRYAILASILMFLVLFSTGSESVTYIIAVLGVCVWYISMPQHRTKWDIGLMVFVFLITSMSPSDLFPRYIEETIIKPYALKALPVFCVWLKLTYELLTIDYGKSTNETAKP